MIAGQNRPLSVVQQGAALKRVQPHSVVRYSGHQDMIWKGHVQPTPMSCEYEVEIGYQLKHFPRTRVLKPELISPEGERIPHMYDQKRLCLFHPKFGDWRPTMLIANSILPWAALWLFYYEVWLAVGEWHGGGEHPRRRSDL